VARAQGIWRSLLLGFPIALVLAGFGGYALARKALAPIDSMATQAKTISAERLSDRLSIENPEDELGKLGAVFNDTLARLQAAFDQLRRFTADASHELRTPLTAIRSVGEVALQDQRSPAEYRDVIGSMLEEVDRLTRLAESLLALSRADAGHVQLQREDISLVHVAREASSLVEVLAEEKRQRFDIEGNADLLVSVDRLILRQAIVNLLDNAIKYSPAESRILVRVQSEVTSRCPWTWSTRDLEFPANISRMFSTAFTGLIKHEHGNGVARALDCPSLAGPSKRTAAA